MSNPHANVARKVIKRLAKENPGHVDVDESVIEPEFSEAFPDAQGRMREQRKSNVLEWIDRIVPERHSEALYSSMTGERLCLEVFPIIWPHTAAQV